jgi:hypothetical protein
MERTHYENQFPPGSRLDQKGISSKERSPDRGARALSAHANDVTASPPSHKTGTCGAASVPVLSIRFPSEISGKQHAKQTSVT